MPLYITSNVAIKPNWQSLTKLANDLENDNFEQTFDLHNLKKFEEIIGKDHGKTLVQNIMSLE
jgi:hypothetical protein